MPKTRVVSVQLFPPEIPPSVTQEQLVFGQETP